MPETEHSAEIAAPVERVWGFVEVLENWAPYLVGFEKLELVDERRSIWTLRGDVGILSREVDLQADITLWEPLRRVEFTVTGLTERLEGSGFFLLEAIDDAEGTEGGGVGSSGAAVTHRTDRADDPARRPSFLERLRLAIARSVLRRITRRSARGRPPAPPAPQQAPTADAADQAGGAGSRSRLTFKLQMSVGGPMAPMVELLMAPMLDPAAQDLADAIRTAVETR